MNLIIKNGTLITDSEQFKADIFIQDGRIKQVGLDMAVPSDTEIVDADGLLVMPGGVDVHTHLELPMFNTVSSDDHYTGHKAAAFGGTTTVMDFISQDDPDLIRCVDLWHKKADSKAAVDYSFHINITQFSSKILLQIPELVDEGITSVKMFTAYNNRLRLGDGEIFQVMRVCREAGILPMVHAENGDVIEVLVAEALATGNTGPVWHARTRPAWGAVESVLRAIALAVQADSPLYVVHMNTAGGVEQLKLAREKGHPVFGETCPPYLFFSEDDLAKEDGAKWICSPPMRSKADNDGVWQGLIDGTLQTIGTDHCPFFYDGTRGIQYEGKTVKIPGKELGKDNFTKIPNGLPGIGDRLPVMWTQGVGTGRLTPQQFVALNCTNPAKLFGIYPQKGCLLPGTDADIVLWDSEKEVEYGVKLAHHRTDYNLYEGWKLKGMPVQVFLRGKMIVDHGRWLGRRGMGKFLKRKVFHPYGFG
ncbi:MAG: dihydropyrimidinase [Anaerolineaceae bacterium]|nr:dihydropyrimidinase [Anaerolineaceae bacterium]